MEAARKAWDPMELTPSMDAMEDEKRTYTNIIHVLNELETIKTHPDIQNCAPERAEKFQAEHGSPQRPNWLALASQARPAVTGP